MITGCHNPPEYNGFKVGVGKTTFHGEDIQALRRRISRGPLRERGRGRSTTHDIVTPYQDYVAARTCSSARRKLKVVVDAGNGTGGVIAVPLFRVARLRGGPALLRDGRPLPQPPPRPDGGEEPRGS